MRDDLKLDGRTWRFLGRDGYKNYAECEAGQKAGLKAEPLERQFRTVKEILHRFQKGRGVLLADDVGLGKTTVGALVAWIVATQTDDKGNFCNRVRIYAPNYVLRRRWAEELERHVPMLEQIGANRNRIRQGEVERLRSGTIQVATHHALVKSHGNNEQRTACDLMIIDEAHRAKGDGSAFSEALKCLGSNAKRKLILTATPFSIRLAELEQLLKFVGATDLEKVSGYAGELERLYSLGDGHDVTAESKRLVEAAKGAIEELQPYLIRHGIEDLSAPEQKHFGAVAATSWMIPTPPATEKDLELLLRMDRLLQLTPEHKGERRNDPRFHIGWQHVGVELQCTKERASDPIACRHIELASEALCAMQAKPHPKIEAVTDAIRPIIDAGEKVLVFCHHHSTANELLGVLEQALKAPIAYSGPPEKVWRAAWKSLLLRLDENPLAKPIINWLCTPGVCTQVSGWLGRPARKVEDLKHQLATTRPRHAPSKVATILESAQALIDALLGHQSKSTRSVLRSIAKGNREFGGKAAHFPGQMDLGLRVMGAWQFDGKRNSSGEPLDEAGRPLKTLYTREIDIVLALFNSPFGPDVLVATDRLSEGVDLHRYCRHLIHYELDPSPVRTLQRNGRVRRVDSWAALTGQPIQYAYPAFVGTRDEKAVEVMERRIKTFGLLLGGVPPISPNGDDGRNQGFAELVLDNATCKKLSGSNLALCVPRARRSTKKTALK